MHFFAFYVETETQVGTGICGTAAVFFFQKLISGFFQGSMEILQVKIFIVGLRILAKKLFHGSGGMVKVKISADKVCLWRQIGEQLFI